MTPPGRTSSGQFYWNPMRPRPGASSEFDGPLGLQMGQGAGLISLNPVKQGPWVEIGRLSKNGTVSQMVRVLSALVLLIYVSMQRTALNRV